MQPLPFLGFSFPVKRSPTCTDASTLAGDPFHVKPFRLWNVASLVKLRSFTWNYRGNLARQGGNAAVQTPA